MRVAEAELQAAVDALKAEEDAFNAKIASFEAAKVDDSLSAMKRARASNELEQLKSKDNLPLRRAKITQEAALKRVQRERKLCEVATAKATEKATIAATAHDLATERLVASQEAEANSQVAAERASEATKLADVAAQNAAESEKQSVASKNEAAAARAMAEERAEESRVAEEQSALAAQKASEAKAACVVAAQAVEVAVVETEAKLTEAVANLERVKKSGGVPLGSIWWMEREIQEAQKYLPKNKRK